MAGRTGVPINRYVSQEAFDGWTSWCEANGVTLTSVLDVVGRRLGAGWQPPRQAVREILAEARQRDHDSALAGTRARKAARSAKKA